MLLRRVLATLAFALTLPVFPAPALIGQSKPAAPSKAGTASTTQTRQVTAAQPAAGSTQPLDLNTATPEQLKSLPGIGDAYAKRIIDGRPYAMKNQLTQRGILPQATYDKIKDIIVARRPAKK